MDSEYKSDLKKLKKLQKTYDKNKKQIINLGKKLIKVTGNPYIVDEFFASWSEAGPPPKTPTA